MQMQHSESPPGLLSAAPRVMREQTRQVLGSYLVVFVLAHDVMKLLIFAQILSVSSEIQCDGIQRTNSKSMIWLTAC